MQLKNRVTTINEKNMEWLQWLHGEVTIDRLEMIVNDCVRNMIIEVLEDDWANYSTNLLHQLLIKLWHWRI